MAPSDWAGAGAYRWWICWLGYWYVCCWYVFMDGGAAWCCKGDGVCCGAVCRGAAAGTAP
jgi:hypothetical protein